MELSDVMGDDEDDFTTITDEGKMEYLQKESAKIKSLSDEYIEMIVRSKDNVLPGSAQQMVILKKYQDILENEINSKELDRRGLEMKEESLRKIKLLEKIRIVDPRVLLKIFNMYKYPQPTLKDFII